MPLSRNAKIGIAVGVGLAALAFTGAASAADGDDDDDDDEGCPPGFHPVPNVDGTSSCVADIIFNPVEPDPEPEPDPEEPLPPLPNVCKYSGCGAPFDNTHQHPSVYALRIQQLGYPINVAGIAANGTFMAVNPARGIVRDFQWDFNTVRASNGANGPAALAGVAATNALNTLKSTSKLSTDGLNGNNTITAVQRAQALVNAMGMSWENIVNLS